MQLGQKIEGRRTTVVAQFVPKILAVGGGKGGIGKSFFSANLGVALAKMGCRVALVDLDLGASNLHTCLGIPSPKLGLSEFFSGKAETLDTLSVQTGITGLELFSGGQEFWQQIRPQPAQKMKLIAKLQGLNCEYVILDLGAGTHVNTLDFFVYSNIGLIVVIPEPTSIENAYVFLKSVLFRKVQNIIKALQCDDVCAGLLQSLSDSRMAPPPYVLLENFSKENPGVGGRILQLVKNTRLEIVMNQVRTKADMELGASMTHISKQFFGFDAFHLGSTPYDDAVWKAVRARKNLFSESPDSEIVQSLSALAKSFQDRYGGPAL